MSTDLQKPGPGEPGAPEADKPRSWLGRMFSRLAGWLGGHDFHYAGYLPRRPGFLLRCTLDPFFNRVTVHPRYLERLQELAGQGAVVYALKYRSHLDFLFFNRRYQKLGVAPEVAFDLNLWMWQPFSHLLQIISAAVIISPGAGPGPILSRTAIFTRRSRKNAALCCSWWTRWGSASVSSSPGKTPSAISWKSRSRWISPSSWSPRW